MTGLTWTNTHCEVGTQLTAVDNAAIQTLPNLLNLSLVSSKEINIQRVLGGVRLVQTVGPSGSNSGARQRITRTNPTDRGSVQSAQSVQAHSSRASAQRARRSLARLRGDCLVCCRRPATMGTRCSRCLGYRNQETAVVGGPKPSRVEQYWIARSQGLCGTRGCGAPSPTHAACLECRLTAKLKREARRQWSAAAGATITSPALIGAGAAADAVQGSAGGGA